MCAPFTRPRLYGLHEHRRKPSSLKRVRCTEGLDMDAPVGVVGEHLPRGVLIRLGQPRVHERTNRPVDNRDQMQLSSTPRPLELRLEPPGQTELIGHPKVFREEVDVVASVVEPDTGQGGSVTRPCSTNVCPH